MVENVVALRGVPHPASWRIGAAHAAAGSSPSQDLSTRIGEHSYWCIGNPHCVPGPSSFVGVEFNLDTIAMTLIVMALIVALAFYVRTRLTDKTPRGVQNVVELAVEFVNGFVSDSLGNERLPSIGPLAVALFLFILISNYIGLIPVPVNWWHAPTSDLNTTAGLAITVFVLIQVLSLRARRPGGYIKHFFTPVFLFPINLIEEGSKPITLAMRLFGNIFAGEVLILVFGSLLTGFLTVALPLGYGFALGLGLFVGAIQAFIFTLLTVSYIGIATTTEGH